MSAVAEQELTVRLNTPHPKQAGFVDSTAKRIVVRAGRRGGKTVGVSIRAVKRFLAGRRVLYAAPTQEQIDRFWVEVSRALHEPIEAGVLYKNETRHIIELSGTEQRIRAKTAWNADTLRGDYADDLILDEWQLMNEDAWGVVGAPMLLDNNGDATFIYTPPSLRSRSTSKANDPQHAAKLFKKFEAEERAGNRRYATFHFSSHDNPHISEEALADITGDMTALSYRMEIEAQDVDEAPGALWNRQMIEAGRRVKHPGLERVVVGVDPSATSTGDEAGIITAGKSGDEAYVLADDSVQGSPRTWATAAVTAYHTHEADCIVAEANNGGEMVALTIATVDPKVPVRLVHASRGKQTRAEPVASVYEHGRGHHVGSFPVLEDEMCLWTPGDKSPNRMDALVWTLTKLMLGPKASPPSDLPATSGYSIFEGSHA
jgi:Terminase RNaseH-like domain